MELGSERRYLTRRRRGEPSLDDTEDAFVSVVRLSEESGPSPAAMSRKAMGSSGKQREELV